MMKVWKFESNDKEFRITNINREDNKIIREVVGEEKKNWEPVDFITESNRRRNSDFPHIMNGLFAIQDKAKSIIEPYILDKVQFLPINFHDKDVLKEMHIMNVTNIIDCLDEENTQYDIWFDGTRGIVTKEHFFADKLSEDDLLFKIKQTSRSDVYCTDKFKKLIESHKLKGIHFREVWDSETDLALEKEAEVRYEQRIAEINASLDHNLPWSAIGEVLDRGKAVISGRWKLQKDENGDIIMGQLNLDLEYSTWMIPTFYPPVFLEMYWSETEASEI